MSILWERRLKSDPLRDVIGVAGFVALCVGAWLVYPPAGLIVGGTLGLAFGILADTRGIRR